MLETKAPQICNKNEKNANLGQIHSLKLIKNSNLPGVKIDSARLNRVRITGLANIKDGALQKVQHAVRKAVF